MIKNLKLGTKLALGFTSVTAVLIGIGILGYISIQAIDAKILVVEKEVPLMDAAMEMKLSVRHDMQILMEMLEAENKKELEEIWNEHLKISDHFQQYADAILMGKKVEDETIYKTEDQHLQEIVKKAATFHKETFEPKFREIHDKKLREYKIDEEIGLSSTLGLRGIMRKAAHSFEEIIRNTKDSHRQDHEYLMTRRHEKDFIMRVQDKYIKKANETLDMLYKLSDELKTDRQTIDTFKKYVISYREAFNKLADAKKEQTNLEKEILEADEVADAAGSEMLTIIDEVEESAKESITTSLHDSISISQLAIKTSIIAVLFGTVLAAVLGYIITRSITLPINKVIAGLTLASDQVSSASKEIANSSQMTAQGANEQASNLEETSSSLEEMSAMIKQNTSNSKEADSLASDANEAAMRGDQAMKEMVSAINEINTSTDETAKIIKTIDEIAFQTNLLALNAAVEAARAGDAGKGFAVVAEEVRSLAQRSAEAAKDTSALIETSLENAKNGVSVSENVSQVLTEIMDYVSKTSALIKEVSTASDEQSRGIEQLNNAVAEMNKVTQSTAANSEESAAAAEELSGQAVQLNHHVENLNLIITSKKKATLKVNKTESVLQKEEKLIEESKPE